MATLDRVNINADRYCWAIQRAGLAVDEYLEQHPKVALWIEGTKMPTVKQLEEFARNVNVPFGFLFLDNTPHEEVPIPMFRGEAGRYEHFDLNVYDTVNAIQQRQDWLEDYLVENEIDTCSFVNSADLQTPIAEAVSKLRSILALESRWALGLANINMAISKLTESLESAGVFIAYNGVVGNNTHRVLKVSECRGFALVNNVAPYVFVNSGDAPAAQMFTLIHETAHLMLGVSAGHANDGTDKLCHDAVERWCDNVAAEFLVPAVELLTMWNGNIKIAAKKFKVSELVVARRAHDLGLISGNEYRDFWHEYSSRPYSKKNSSGGSFYRTSVKRVGRLFAMHVKNAVVNRQLSYTDAYKLTGLYGKTYNHFMDNNI
ncbi:ImmA/IrrE family metallo-endopeptidase [Parabacteroides johnsonii]|uniref:ImmA/IrrE family metallo-endopeptidase n=1 Tax=Parabacteroides johnsonii TaxID=387661 RepID=UPI003F29EE76